VARPIMNASRFHDEEAAFEYVESKLWPNGPVCPHCGNADQKRIRRFAGKSTRLGLRACYECKGRFTVRQGTIFEGSHFPLHLWLQVIHLMCAGKKGISTNQVQRLLSCSMKTAWFLTHRIRTTMRSDSLSPLGGEGMTVEIDETFVGRKNGFEVKHGPFHKNAVLTLVERGGSARSFHVENATKEHIIPIVLENMARESHVMTDEANRYARLGKDFSAHGVVDHSRNEYGYTDRKTGAKINTNTIEGYYSIFKRGNKRRVPTLF
jgi:transposase-like protein